MKKFLNLFKTKSIFFILFLLTLSVLLGCSTRNLYVQGQFEPQTGFIKLNYPEPENYNPKESTHSCSKWIKRCEWWCAEDIEGR